MKWIPRSAAERLRRLVASFLAVLEYGPRQCMADLSLKRGFVITTGEERRSIGKAIKILPWRSVARGEVDIA